MNQAILLKTLFVFSIANFGVFSSCTKLENDIIDFNNSKSSNINKIWNSHQIVPLETSIESLIGNGIVEIEYYNDHFLVTNISPLGKELLVFFNVYCI